MSMREGRIFIKRRRSFMMMMMCSLRVHTDHEVMGYIFKSVPKRTEKKQKETRTLTMLTPPLLVCIMLEGTEGDMVYMVYMQNFTFLPSSLCLQVSYIMFFLILTGEI